MNQSIQLKRIRSTFPIVIALVLVHLTAVADPSRNTSYGIGALPGNPGLAQTAIGYFALHSGPNTEANTAVGELTLENDTTGDVNTAVGGAALRQNTTGRENTAVGAAAGFSNQTGNQNTVVGASAGYPNQTGNQNTVIGEEALGNRNMNDIGSNNIAVGFKAGFNLGQGNNYNVDIGNQGVTGDSSAIRIGDNNHTSTFIAGISGVAISGAGVFVNPSGQLGVAASSARFKNDIKPMDKASEAILELKPVSFHYTKDIDAAGTSQFGLVAEQVEKVNPDLVVHDKEGKPYTVRYEAVNAMLLNEFLKAHQRIEEQDKRIEQLTAQLKVQALFIQKVNDKVELNRPVPRAVLNNQ